MSLRALFYAYVLGGLTLVPLLLLASLCFSIYTSVPVPVPVPAPAPASAPASATEHPVPDTADTADLPRSRKAWLTVRRSFHDPSSDASYVTLVRSYLDARSKDPKRSRPKDMWYVVLKGTVLYLYEDEHMTECDAAIELSRHHVLVYPEGLLDGELFTRRNAICLRPRSSSSPPSPVADASQDESNADPPRDEAPWFIFVRSCVDMEDWYLALVHASDHPPGTPTLAPLSPVFLPSEMNYLVATLDEQPDVIPMRWFNALLGRVFYSFYRTQMLESYIIGRLMKKLSKVKRPAFLADVAVTQFSVGNKAPTFSKPMLKELTKEGDASLEVGFLYKGEIRATVEATAVINLGARFKSYTVKLVLAVVIRELEGNLLVRVKRPPSTRIWYAFTKAPRMVINVEPIVSDRQITWSMILNTIESKIEEIIIDSVVLPNMDDISFFDSTDYEHRGGVWADAARSDKPVAPEEITKPSAPDFASHPLEEAGPSILVRAHSEEEPTAENLSPVARSVTTSLEKTSTTARRRSWFYSGADTELNGEHAEQVEEEQVKERSAEPDGTLAPPSDVSSTGQHLDVSDNEHEYLLPRSSSAQSHARARSIRAHSFSSSVGGDESSNYLSDTSATSNKSPRLSTGTLAASSFLSTLKSKAGDKQALSNTAKEAMRKWGVNWGLKRENPSPDEVADAGPSDHHRPRTVSTQGRISYAERRAVAVERREGEPTESVNGSTSPIPIPQWGGSSTSRSSSPGLSRSFGEVGSDSFRDRDLTESGEESAAPSLIHTQPSQARTMTIPGIHASHKGEVMSMGNVAPAASVPESKPKAAAIQSMYRLWKSPILSGQQSQEGTPSSSAQDGDMNEGNHDVAPLSLTSEVISPPPRSVPPPLPPRTVSSIAVRHPTESVDESQVVPPVSAASAALMTIASRDETRREGEPEATTVPAAARRDSRPPLPPRRVG